MWYYRKRWPTFCFPVKLKWACSQQDHTKFWSGGAISVMDFFFSTQVFFLITRFSSNSMNLEISSSSVCFIIWQTCWWWSLLNFWDPYCAIISFLTVFSFPHCKTRLGFPRVHLPIVYLRYTLHVFSYMVNDMLALTIFLILFSFCLNLFCLALCTWLKGISVPKGKS